MVEISEIIKSIVSDGAVVFIAAGVLLNTALAVAVAIREGRFTFTRLADFLWRDMLPLVITYFAFRLVGEAVQMPMIAPAVFALIASKIIAEIAGRLKTLRVDI